MASFPDPGFQQASKAVDETVTFSIPVVFGQPFELGVWASAQVGARNQIDSSDSTADFSQGLLWAGTPALIVGGQTITQGFSISSASGIDWTLPSPIPEPSTWALMLGGGGLLLFLARRRRG